MPCRFESYQAHFYKSQVVDIQLFGFFFIILVSIFSMLSNLFVGDRKSKKHITNSFLFNLSLIVNISDFSLQEKTFASYLLYPYRNKRQKYIPFALHLLYNRDTTHAKTQKNRKQPKSFPILIFIMFLLTLSINKLQ